MTELEELQATVSAIASHVVGQEVDAARDEALRRHPEVEPFRDLIVGDDPSQVVALVEQLAERVAKVPRPEPSAPSPRPKRGMDALNDYLGEHVAPHLPKVQG